MDDLEPALRRAELVPLMAIGRKANRLPDGKFLGCQSVLAHVSRPIGDSMQIHDDQIRKASDPFQIKNLAHPSNRQANIARRRAKHGIALYFPPLLQF